MDVYVLSGLDCCLAIAEMLLAAGDVQSVGQGTPVGGACGCLTRRSNFHKYKECQ